MFSACNPFLLTASLLSSYFLVNLPLFSYILILPSCSYFLASDVLSVLCRPASVFLWGAICRMRLACVPATTSLIAKQMNLNGSSLQMCSTADLKVMVVLVDSAPWGFTFFDVIIASNANEKYDKACPLTPRCLRKVSIAVKHYLSTDTYCESLLAAAWESSVSHSSLQLYLQF